MEHMNIRVNFNMADYSNLKFDQKDKQILSELAKRMAEQAAKPIMQERKKLWYAHNALERTRPVILADPENGWNEIIPDSTIECTNSIARYWELHLKKQIYWGEKMNDDYVVEPLFTLPYVHTVKPWRLADKESKFTKAMKMDDGEAYHIDAIMEEYDELKNVRKEEFDVDYEATNQLFEMAQELFDGSLTTRLDTAWFWSFGLTDEAAFLRGMETLMYDFYDEPDEVHEMMAMLRDGVMDKMDFLEENGLFHLNNDNSYVGSGGIGYTHELPAPDFDGKVRTKDMWGLSESQITVGVSPDMFEEFIFPYQKPIMERFGLTCYGCCEPMDDRFDIVKQVKNLRRVSVSPWANQKIMSEKLGHDYIYSLKPSPSPLALPVLDQDLVRASIKEALGNAKDNCLEFMMKDNHTLGGNPDNLLNWVRICREEIESM
ncbi:MAG: hypothetical protein ACOX2M_06730 [Fastidiosipilaceae bacterium]|jgi:hypothetical protein